MHKLQVIHLSSSGSSGLTSKLQINYIKATFKTYALLVLISFHFNHGSSTKSTSKNVTVKPTWRKKLFLCVALTKRRKYTILGKSLTIKIKINTKRWLSITYQIVQINKNLRKVVILKMNMMILYIVFLSHSTSARTLTNATLK